MNRLFYALLLCLLTSVSLAHAAPVYLAPRNSVSAGPRTGSVSAPFNRIKDAVQAVETGAGDEIILLEGHYGKAYWADLKPAKPIKITARAQSSAHFQSLSLRQVKNLHFVGFNIWPGKPRAKQIPFVSSDEHSSDLIFEQFDIRARADAADTYMEWSHTDWQKTWTGHGFKLKSPNTTIRDSQITATSYAIVVSGRGSQVINNLVLGFSRDGIRGLGNDSVYRGNRILNCFGLDDHHDDGFQSWAPFRQGPDSAVRNVIFEDNVIWDWLGRPDHPLRGRLQGIGLFDGHYENFTIRNNLVVVDHYHGISIYGGKNSLIEHNTVVNSEPHKSERPWINVQPHKNGVASHNVRVRDNISVAYRGIAHAARNNVVARFAHQAFNAPAKGDFSPRQDGPLKGLDLGSTLVYKFTSGNITAAPLAQSN